MQLQTRMTAAENNIDDVYTDVTDMITAYKEPSATSTHAYAIGDYFIYNETLYKATAAIAIGATIVPNTNCETTNVSSELKQINNDLASKQDKLKTKTVTGTTDTFGHLQIVAASTATPILATSSGKICTLFIDSGTYYVDIKDYSGSSVSSTSISVGIAYYGTTF